MARLVSSESLKCSRIELMITNWYSFSPIEWQFHELNIFVHQMIPNFTMCKFISPLENTYSPNDRFHEVNFHQMISPRCLHPPYTAHKYLAQILSYAFLFVFRFSQTIFRYLFCFSSKNIKYFGIFLFLGILVEKNVWSFLVEKMGSPVEKTWKDVIVTWYLFDFEMAPVD